MWIPILSMVFLIISQTLVFMGCSLYPIGYYTVGLKAEIKMWCRFDYYDVGILLEYKNGEFVVNRIKVEG